MSPDKLRLIDAKEKIKDLREKNTKYLQNKLIENIYR